ncbi:MAG: hypothetical protein ACI8X5_001693 [Planctomycetota bacterium]|jgi:hypothetical protein
MKPMKNAAIITGLAAGLISGAISAVVVLQLQGPEVAGAAEGLNSIGPASDLGVEQVRSEVDRLAKENNDLMMRLVALEGRSSSSRDAVATQTEAVDNAELQKQIAELAAALKNPQSAQSAGLRNIVAVAMEEVRETEEQERDLEREQRDVDRIIERMGEYSEKLGLDAVQKKSMQAALIDSNNKRGELFATMREGGSDRDEIRATFGTLREETEGALGRILSPTQLEDYKEMEDRGRFGFGGGGRGGRGGGQ